MLDADAAGRAVREMGFARDPVRIGRFDAFDYFGDGAFYLLDAPGHAVGHLAALARVTAAGGGGGEDSFVFLGADACHHPGVLRPTEFLPLPPRDPAMPTGPCAGRGCPGEVLHPLLPGRSPTEPFLTVSPSLFPDHAAARGTVRQIAELDAAENVLVILAHDESIKGHIGLFPGSIINWKALDLCSRTRWLFCKDFVNALEVVRHRDWWG